MGPHHPEVLRPLTKDEAATLCSISRAGRERADRVSRASALLAVAAGANFSEAARRSGRRSSFGVARLVARFNQVGLAALETRHGGGHAVQYTTQARGRILREVQRSPDREVDGTATWSLTTLQRALRSAPDGLPRVSTWTIWQALKEAGYSWQQRRTWCTTGAAQRVRKSGVVTVTDPDATPKKS